MRFLPRRWHAATWSCSASGHAAPAAAAAELRPGDAALGVDMDDGTRMVRCLRCDLWLRLEPPAPAEAAYHHIPPLDELELPLRGAALEDRIITRIVAAERAIHVLLFGLVAIGALLVQMRLPTLHDWAQNLVDTFQSAVDQSARGASNQFLVDELQRLIGLGRDQLWAVAAVAGAYAVLEAVEAVFLWKGRRWAEYLTVVATAGFIPFELRELADGVSALKVFALVVNVAILIWLVWHKRLFGLRGGTAALRSQLAVDWDEVLASPLTPDAKGRLRTGPAPAEPEQT